MAHDVDSFEISRSKARLPYLEQHHRNCIVGRQPSPPLDEDTFIDPRPSGKLSPADTGKGLKIVSFEPQSLERPQKKQLTAELQWKQIADRLVKKVPDAKGWVQKREAFGLQEMKKYTLAISTQFFLEPTVTNTRR